MDLAVDDGKIDMKRKWNWPIWVGFVIAVGGLFSYEFFAQFQSPAIFRGQIFCSLQLALPC
jgi:hypothetical protein